MEAETAVTQPHAREGQRPLEAGRAGTGPFSEPTGGMWPYQCLDFSAEKLISDVRLLSF